MKYQTEPLRDLYEGIFAKSFTLFYGETLRYYFEISNRRAGKSDTGEGTYNE